jgi:hypothetical protein
MAAVLELRSAKTADPAVVEHLEELLAMARQGKILAIAFAAQQVEATTSTVYALGKHGDVAHLLYALECLKQRLLGR